MSYLREAYALPNLKNNSSSKGTDSGTNRIHFINQGKDELPSSRFIDKWREHMTKDSDHFINANVVIIAQVFQKNGNKLFDISLEDNTRLPYWDGFKGKKGVVYVYADDRYDVYREVFVEDYVKTAKKPTKPVKKKIPGWFSHGDGPFARIAYEIGGEQAVQDFIKWEDDFTEDVRVYLTYKAPLSSDVIKISEAINGETLEGGIKLSTKERISKLISGIEGIATLFTGGAYGVIKKYCDSFIDHIIDKNVESENVKKGLKEGKKGLWKELDKRYKKKP